MQHHHPRAEAVSRGDQPLQAVLRGVQQAGLGHAGLHAPGAAHQDRGPAPQLQEEERGHSEEDGRAQVRGLEGELEREDGRQEWQLDIRHESRTRYIWTSKLRYVICICFEH